MKPAPFSFEAAQSIDAVVEVLQEHGDEAKILAGGQSLVPMLALRLARFSVLVDINRLSDLQSISIASDGAVRIGAMVRQSSVERDPLCAEHVPMVAEATRMIGHPQVRNRGTIGGSVAHADPAAEYPAVALVLGAVLEIEGVGGSRFVPARDFFLGHWSTALTPTEVLAAIRFPAMPHSSGWSVREAARRHGDFALVGTAVTVSVDGDQISDASIAFFGVADRPVLVDGIDELVRGQAVADLDLVDVGRSAVSELDPPNDVHASGAYRTEVGARLATRALQEAIRRAKEVAA